MWNQTRVLEIGIKFMSFVTMLPLRGTPKRNECTHWHETALIDPSIPGDATR